MKYLQYFKTVKWICLPSALFYINKDLQYFKTYKYFKVFFLKSQFYI